MSADARRCRALIKRLVAQSQQQIRQRVMQSEQGNRVDNGGQAHEASPSTETLDESIEHVRYLQHDERGNRRHIK